MPLTYEEIEAELKAEGSLSQDYTWDDPPPAKETSQEPVQATGKKLTYEDIRKELIADGSLRNDQVGRYESDDPRVSIALDKIGGPYLLGGTDWKTGVDCSFFTSQMLKKRGVQVSALAKKQWAETDRTDNPDIGDLIFFKGTRGAMPGVTHVGYYVGGNKMIHAGNTKTGIVMQSIDTPYYKKHFAGFGSTESARNRAQREAKRMGKIVQNMDPVGGPASGEEVLGQMWGPGDQTTEEEKLNTVTHMATLHNRLAAERLNKRRDYDSPIAGLIDDDSQVHKKPVIRLGTEPGAGRREQLVALGAPVALGLGAVGGVVAGSAAILGWGAIAAEAMVDDMNNVVRDRKQHGVSQQIPKGMMASAKQAKDLGFLDDARGDALFGNLIASKTPEEADAAVIDAAKLGQLIKIAGVTKGTKEIAARDLKPWNRDFWNEYLGGNGEALVFDLVRNYARQAPEMVQGAVGAVGLARKLGVVGAKVVSKAVGLRGEFSVEERSAFVQAMEESGVDMTSPASIRLFFQDPVRKEKARTYAQTRGLAIASFDAAFEMIGAKVLDKVLYKSANKIANAVKVAAKEAVSAPGAAPATIHAAVKHAVQLTAPKLSEEHAARMANVVLRAHAGGLPEEAVDQVIDKASRIVTKNVWNTALGTTSELVTGTMGESGSEAFAQGATGSNPLDPQNIKEWMMEGIQGGFGTAAQTAGAIVAEGGIAAVSPSQKSVWAPEARLQRAPLRTNLRQEDDGTYRVSFDEQESPVAYATQEEAVSATNDPIYRAKKLQRLVEEAPGTRNGAAGVQFVANDDGSLNVTFENGEALTIDSGDNDDMLRLRDESAESRAAFERSAAERGVDVESVPPAVTLGNGNIVMHNNASLGEMTHELWHFFRRIGLVSAEEVQTIAAWAGPKYNMVSNDVEETAAYAVQDAANRYANRKTKKGIRGYPDAVGLVMDRIKSFMRTIVDRDYRNAKPIIDRLVMGQTQAATPGAITPQIAASMADIQARAQQAAGPPIPEPPVDPTAEAPVEEAPEEPPVASSPELGQYVPEIEYIDSRTVGVHPDVQFKREGIVDKVKKVTGLLKGLKEYNVGTGGILEIWEPNDKQYGDVVWKHGHHRGELSQRAESHVFDTPGGTMPMRNHFVPVRRYKESEGWTLREVRGRAALDNIRDGKGAAIDAVRAMKDLDIGRDDVVSAGVAPDSKLYRDIAGLMNLSEEMLSNVANKGVRESVAAAIGEVFPDDNQLQDIVIRGATDNNIKTHEEAIRYANNVNTAEDILQIKEESAQGDLFGRGDTSVVKLVDVGAIRTNLETKMASVAEKHRQAWLRPTTSQLQKGEHINVAERQKLAAEIGEHAGAFAEKLQFILDRNESVRNAVKQSAERIARKQSTQDEEVAKLLWPIVKHIAKHGLRAAQTADFSVEDAASTSQSGGTRRKPAKRVGKKAAPESAGVTSHPEDTDDYAQLIDLAADSGGGWHTWPTYTGTQAEIFAKAVSAGVVEHQIVNGVDQWRAPNQKALTEWYAKEQALKDGNKEDRPLEDDDLTPEEAVAAASDSDILGLAGLTVTEATAKTGRVYWYVTGETLAYADLLTSLGAKPPTMINKVWRRTFFDGDPTAEIAAQLRNGGEDTGSGEGLEGDSRPSGDSAWDLAAKRRRKQLDSIPDESEIGPDSADAIDELRKSFGVDEAPDKIDYDNPQFATRISKKDLEGQAEDSIKIITAWMKEKPLFVLANAPGTGKTFVLGHTVKALMKRGVKNIHWTTQNQALILQAKSDLAHLGIDDVTWHTYVEMREADVPYDMGALILDESHNGVDIDSQQGKAVKRYMSQAKFTILSSATPFANPAEAAYLEPSGIFQAAGGFKDWATSFGAHVMRVGMEVTPQGMRPKYRVFWPSSGNSRIAETLAANEWLRKQGMFTYRGISVDPAMVDSVFHRTNVDKIHVDRVNQIMDAYSEAVDMDGDELIYGDGMDRQVTSGIKMHETNLLKRVLEAAKVKEAIARTKELLDQGKQAIIFIETKSDRQIGMFRQSNDPKGQKGKLYTFPQMEEQMERWADIVRENMAMPPALRESNPKRPFAPFIMRIAWAMHRNGINYQLPGIARELSAAFPKGTVAMYTGAMNANEDEVAVTESSAAKDRDAWKAGTKKVIVSTMAKGGTGLSYHDTVGDMPERVQIGINLPWSAKQVDQVMGRLVRTGTAKRVGVRWIFADNIPFERSLARRVGDRMIDMGAILKGIDTPEGQVLSEFDFEDGFDPREGRNGPKPGEAAGPQFATRMEPPPTNTVKAYKLMEVGKDGQLYPLFIGDKDPVPVGVWMDAEFIPTKGYAPHPGWHTAEKPVAPHLMKKTGEMMDDRVWVEVELSNDDTHWQAVADANSKHHIPNQVPENGMYSYPRSKKQGDRWYIGGSMKVNKILSAAEVQEVLSLYPDAELKNSQFAGNNSKSKKKNSQFAARRVEGMGSLGLFGDDDKNLEEGAYNPNKTHRQYRSFLKPAPTDQEDITNVAFKDPLNPYGWVMAQDNLTPERMVELGVFEEPVGPVSSFKVGERRISLDGMTTQKYAGNNTWSEFTTKWSTPKNVQANEAAKWVLDTKNNRAALKLMNRDVVNPDAPPTYQQGSLFATRRQAEELGEHFYSELETYVTDKLPNSFTVDTLVSKLGSSPVGADERRWRGVDDFIEAVQQRPDKTITKQELLDHVMANQVTIEELDMSNGKTNKLKKDLENINTRWHRAHEDAETTRNQAEFRVRARINRGWGGSEIADEFDTLSRNVRSTHEDWMFSKEMPGIRDTKSLDYMDAYQALQLFVQSHDAEYKRAKALEKELQNSYKAKRAELDELAISQQPSRWATYRLLTPDSKKGEESESEDYHELLLKLPAKNRTAPPDWQKHAGQTEWDGSDTATGTFRHLHWRDIENPLLHVRFSAFKDALGKPWLLIHEMQSDWHQIGATKGYADNTGREAELKQTIKTLQAELKENDTKFGEIDERLADLRATTYQEMSWGWLAKMAPNGLTDSRRMRALEDLWSEVDKQPQIEALREDWRRAIVETERITDLKDDADAELRGLASRPPAAPFADTWHRLGLRRMLQYAADNGYERMAITNGDAISTALQISLKATNQKTGRLQRAGNRNFYNKKLPEALAKIVKSFGAKMEDVALPADNRHTDVSTHHNDAVSALSEVNPDGYHIGFFRPDGTTFATATWMKDNNLWKVVYPDRSVLESSTNKDVEAIRAMVRAKWLETESIPDGPDTTMSAQGVEFTPALVTALKTEPFSQFATRRQAEELGERFYSELETYIVDKLPNTFSVDSLISKLKASPVGADERRWRGVDDFIASVQARPDKNITKQELLDHVMANQVTLEEVHLRQPEHSAKMDKLEGLYERVNYFNDVLHRVKPSALSNFKVSQVRNELTPEVLEEYEALDRDSTEAMDEHNANPVTSVNDPAYMATMERARDAGDKLRAFMRNNDAAYKEALGDYDGAVAAYREAHDEANKTRTKPEWSAYVVEGHSPLTTDNYGELVLKFPDPPRHRRMEDNYNTYASLRGYSPDRITDTWQTDDPVFEQWRVDRSKSDKPITHPYTHLHWHKIENPVVHARYAPMESVNETTERWFVLNELQSDWHQVAAKEGYRTPERIAAERESNARYEEVEMASEPIQRDARKAKERYNELYFHHYQQLHGQTDVTEMFENRRKGTKEDFMVDQNPDVKALRKASEAATKKLEDALKLVETASDQYKAENEGWEDIPPEAPFSESWARLGLRRMLQYAVEQGHTRFAIVNGDVISKALRMDDELDTSTGRNFRTGNRNFYNKKLPDMLRKLGKPYGATVVPVKLGSDYKFTDDMVGHAPEGQHTRTILEKKIDDTHYEYSNPVSGPFAKARKNDGGYWIVESPEITEDRDEILDWGEEDNSETFVQKPTFRGLVRMDIESVRSSINSEWNSYIRTKQQLQKASYDRPVTTGFGFEIPPAMIEALKTEPFSQFATRRSSEDQDQSPRFATHHQQQHVGTPHPEPRVPLEDQDFPSQQVTEGGPYIGSINRSYMDLGNFLHAPEILLGLQDQIEWHAREVEQRRRGVQDWTTAERKATIKALGLTPAMIQRIRPGRAFNDYELEALGIVMMNQAHHVDTLMHIYASTMDPVAEANYMVGLQEFKAIHFAVQGARAEAGRALNICKKMKRTVQMNENRKDRIVKMLLDIQGNVDVEQARLLATIPEGDSMRLYKLVMDAAKLKMKWGQKLHVFLYANMLSGFSSSGANVLGNTMLLTANQAGAKPLAVGIDAIHSMLTGEERTMYFMPAIYKTQAAMAMVDTANIFGMAASGSMEALRYGYSAEEAARMELPQGREFKDIRALGKDWVNPINYPLRALGAQDQFFRTLAEQMTIREMTTTEAVNKLKRSGQRFSTADVLAEAEAIRDNLTEFPHILEAAQAYGDEMLLTAQGGFMMKGTRTFLNLELPGTGFRPFKILVPFFNVPANLVKQGMEWGPLGFVKAADLFGVQTREQKELALARGIIGTTVMVAFYLAAKAKRIDIEEDPPVTKGLRDLQYNSGRRGWSVRIGDTYVPFETFGPFSGSLGAISSYIKGEDKQRAGTATSALQEAFYGMLRTTLDQGFMQGVSNLTKALQEGGAVRDSLIAGTAMQFLPASGMLGNIGNMTDDKRRDIASTDEDTLGSAIWKRMAARIPWVRNQQPSKVDPLGDEIEQNPTGIRAAVRFTGSVVHPDAVRDELLKLGYSPGYVSKVFTKGKRHVSLSGEEWKDYQVDTGSAIKVELAALFSSDKYKQAWDEDKVELIKDKIEEVRSPIRDTVRAKALGEKIPWKRHRHGKEGQRKRWTGED